MSREKKKKKKKRITAFNHYDGDLKKKTCMNLNKMPTSMIYDLYSKHDTKWLLGAKVLAKSCWWTTVQFLPGTNTGYLPAPCRAPVGTVTHLTKPTSSLSPHLFLITGP